MNSKVNTRYQQVIQNLKENSISQPKPIKKPGVVLKEQPHPHRHDKEQSHSLQHKYLYKKMSEKSNHLHSTGNLNKFIKNSQENQNQLEPSQRKNQHDPSKNEIQRKPSQKDVFSEKNKKNKFNIISYRFNHNSKAPAWLLNRKKQRQSDLHSMPSHSKSNERDRRSSPQKPVLLNNIKSQNRVQQIGKESQNSAKKINDRKSPFCAVNISGAQSTFSFKDTNQTSNINESSKFSVLQSKLEKMSDLELINLKLDEQLQDLRFKYENLQEDNNLLMCRMKTVQSQLELCQRKLKENIFKQEHYRETENIMREKIEELEKKLLIAMSKQCQITKKSTPETYSGQVYSYFMTADKQIIQKKNEEISKLNEIISKLRNRVKQINHELSQEKIRNITNLRSIEQKHETENNEKQIEMKRLWELLDQKSQPKYYLKFNTSASKLENYQTSNKITKQ